MKRWDLRQPKRSISILPFTIGLGHTASMSAALPKVPALNRTFSQKLTISTLLLVGAFFVARGLFHPRTSFWLDSSYGLLALTSAVALLLHRRWGVWLGMGTYLGFGLYAVFLLTFREWSWLWLTFGLVSIYAAREVRVDFRSLLRPSLNESGEPMTSLVVWLSEPRPLSSRTLAKYLSNAWGKDFTDAKPASEIETESQADAQANAPPQPYVAGSTPLFLACDQEAMLIIHHRAEPYFTNPKRVAAECSDLRLARLIQTHQAWISIDVLNVLREGVRPESYYPRMARFIAELDHSACMAMYLPQFEQCLPWDDALKAALRSEDPMTALQALQPGPVAGVAGETSVPITS